MHRGLTKKLDYEKGRRQANLQKEGYLQQIRDAGDNFDRGGRTEPKLFSFHGKTLLLDLRPFYQDDKQSLLATLERNWKFTIDGQIGTISQLRKNAKVSNEVAARFEIMRRSILRADEYVLVMHSQKKRQYKMVEIRCNIRPLEPFPNPVFKKHLAFFLKLVGPALA